MWQLPYARIHTNPHLVTHNYLYFTTFYKIVLKSSESGHIIQKFRHILILYLLHTILIHWLVYFAKPRPSPALLPSEAKLNNTAIWMPSFALITNNKKKYLLLKSCHLIEKCSKMTRSRRHFFSSFYEILFLNFKKVHFFYDYFRTRIIGKI